VSEAKAISWRSIVYGTPVLSSDNEPVGKVSEVLGSDGNDIFHGLRVRLAHTRRDVMVSVDDIASMTATEIRTELSRAQLEALPAYDEHATYHLASVGRLRKHVGWKRDSTGDEEPG
jgi:uncharacterized protein YrrD